MASNAGISQHKLMAMGKGVKSPRDAGVTAKKAEFARGGMVGANSRLLKSGIPDSPLETAKKMNGIPGFKDGGKAKKK